MLYKGLFVDDPCPTCYFCGEDIDKRELYEGSKVCFCEECVLYYRREYAFLEKVADEYADPVKVELPALITDLLTVDEITQILYRHIENTDMDGKKFLLNHKAEVGYALEEY